MNKQQEFEETKCPSCGSKNYKQGDYDYPILECVECGKRWFSD